MIDRIAAAAGAVGFCWWAVALFASKRTPRPDRQPPAAPTTAEEPAPAPEPAPPPADWEVEVEVIRDPPASRPDPPALTPPAPPEGLPPPMEIARRAYGLLRRVTNDPVGRAQRSIAEQNRRTSEEKKQRIRRARIARTTTKTTTITVGSDTRTAPGTGSGDTTAGTGGTAGPGSVGGTGSAGVAPASFTPLPGTPAGVEAPVPAAALAAPAAAVLIGLADQAAEALTRLARIPPARDIRNPIAQLAALAAVTQHAAATARVLHATFTQDRHDPFVTAAAEQTAAALRIAADAALAATDTAVRRYQGAATDTARGTRLPDLHRH